MRGRMRGKLFFSEAAAATGVAAGAVLLHDTIVWQRMTEVFGLPADVVTALFTGVAAFYGEGQACQLFQEEWLRDCSDRWIAFGSQIQAKSVACEGGEVLAAVFPEFKQHLFGIIRCIRANSRLVSNVRKTDKERLRELAQEHMHINRSSGESNNCLIDSLITD